MGLNHRLGILCAFSYGHCIMKKVLERPLIVGSTGLITLLYYWICEDPMMEWFSQLTVQFDGNDLQKCHVLWMLGCMYTKSNYSLGSSLMGTPCRLGS